MSWTCRNRSYCALGVNTRYITLKIAMIYLDIYFANIYIYIWHLHFSARGSDNTNIINGLDIIHGYQSCVWYIACDIWKNIYYGSTNLFHYFQPSRCLHVSIWKAFTKAHHLLLNKSFRNLPICMYQTLCKIKHFYVNDGVYRFWANCALGNVDIYMLVVAVNGGPIWSVINVQTAELLGDARSVTLVVHQQ